MTLSPILQPINIGDLTLKNRIVIAPLTRSRSSTAGVPPDFAAYYGQRASAGLNVSEATNISPQAVGYAYTPGIWSNDQVEAWTRVISTIYANDGCIFLQLWHTSRLSHSDLQPGSELAVSASAVKPEGTAFTMEGMKSHVTSRALKTDEIPGIVEDYRRAAVNARRAGFDGVEIHSANNYLLEQFVRDLTNRRTDRYGCSSENRLRFPLEVVRAVTEAWDGRSRVGIRLSPASTERLGRSGLPNRLCAQDGEHEVWNNAREPATFRGWVTSALRSASAGSGAGEAQRQDGDAAEAETDASGRIEAEHHSAKAVGRGL